MSSKPKKKQLPLSVTATTTLVRCTKVPRPLRNFKTKIVRKIPTFPNENHLPSETTKSSTNNPKPNSKKVKAIPPDEYYESPPSGFGSAGSGPCPSTTPSKDSGSVSLLSPSPAGTSGIGTGTPLSTSTKASLLLNPTSAEGDSGHGDFEEELQFSSVSSPSLFDPVSDSQEEGSRSSGSSSTSESGSYSYSYTCSNSCCTTGCYSDIDLDATSRSRSRSRSRSEGSERGFDLNELDLEDGPEEAEDPDKSFQVYLKRVEKLKKTLGNWDKFLNENGIVRPDFFCRYKERENLQQIVEEFQEITSRHREGLLTLLHDKRKLSTTNEQMRRRSLSCGELLEDSQTTSGSSGTKIKRNTWRNKRIRKLLAAGGVSGNSHENDASSSNEAAHLQQKLKNLSSELVTLRNRLHVNGQPVNGSSSSANNNNNNPNANSNGSSQNENNNNLNNNNGPQIPPHQSNHNTNSNNNTNSFLNNSSTLGRSHHPGYINQSGGGPGILPYPNKPLPPHPTSPPNNNSSSSGSNGSNLPLLNNGSSHHQNNNNNNNSNNTGYYVNQSFQKDVLRIGPGVDLLGVSNCSSTSSPPEVPTKQISNGGKLGVHVVHGISGLNGHQHAYGLSSTSTNSGGSGSGGNSIHGVVNGLSGGCDGSAGSIIGTATTSGGSGGDATPSESSYKLSNKSVPLLGVSAAVAQRKRVNLSEIEDLIHLSGPLTEDALIRCLQARCAAKSEVYMGPILLMTNRLNAVGNPLTLASTRDIAAPPAMKKVVAEALRQQGDTGYPQAIILSGVSGSGKTYTSMIILRQLFEMAGGGMESDAFKHLAASITVLRSLGTARTALNRDSSRVGHFIEVQVTDGTVYRTKVHCYFLDQTRVVKTATDERNYDIFYQMLAGLTPEEREKLNLKQHTIETLRYLSKGDCRTDEKEDARRFLEWKASLGMLGIPFLDVVRVLTAVILIGNVQFKESSSCMEMDVEGETELQSAAALLGVSETALKQGLTMRTHNVRNQLVRSRCDANLSNFSRDSLAKSLYCRTIATIVRRANSLKRLGSTSGTLSSDSTDSVNNQMEVASQHASTVGTAGSKASKSMTALNNAVRHATDGFIGILDMFGFEDVRPSHLEHLCLNLCAETMQHFYNTHIFKASIESCRDEGIQSDWEVDYVDNVPCIDLISSLRTGLFSMLDVECSVRGTIESYVQKVRTQHKQNPRLLDTKSPEFRSFAIQHYAGKVQYDATEFLDTNRDILVDDLVAVFHKHRCSFGFASHLFSSELKILGAGGMEPSPRGISFRISPTSHTELLNGDEPVSTLTQDFHTRLDNLLRTLVHAKPHFIRCIKINENEQPDLFDRHVVSKQLRAFQVLETVNLMAYGYPHRMRFKAFNARYKLLAPFHQLSRTDDRAIEDCQLILDCFDNCVGSCARERLAHNISISWAHGKRHIFLSEGARQQLESLRTSTRNRAATLIQSTWRGSRCRQRWPIMRQGFHLQFKQQIPPNLPPPNNPMSASAFLVSSGVVAPSSRHQMQMGPPNPPHQTTANSNQNHNQSKSLSPTLPNNPNAVLLGQINHNARTGSSATTSSSTSQSMPHLVSPINGGNGHFMGGSSSQSGNSIQSSDGRMGTNLDPSGCPIISTRATASLPNIPPGGGSSSACGSGSGGSSSLSPPILPPNAPHSVCSSSNSNNSVSGGRPRPQPISGTPPPETVEKCDAKLVQQTCTLIGLDMERPPPLPPSRSYTVAGNTKLGYPQTRRMKMTYPDEGTQSEVRLLKGDSVTVIGTSPRRGHLMVEHKNRTLHVPFQYLELKPPASD